MADANFADVVMLLPMDETYLGTTSPVDQSNARHSLQRYGGATLTSAQSKFGAQSAAFDGSGDYYQTQTLFSALATTDFTIEAWVRFTTGGKGQSWARIFQLGANGVAGGLWLVCTGSDNPTKLLVQGYTSNYIDLCAANTTLANDTWHHVAITRSGNTWTLWVNGASYSTSSNSYSISQTLLTIGANSTASESFNGWIDDFRITYGVARYTTGFSVPSSAFEYGSSWSNPPSPMGRDGAYDAAEHIKGDEPWLDQSAIDISEHPSGVWTPVGRDYYYGGTKTITGTVKEKASPADLPLARLVRLYKEVDGLFVASTWSDSAGTYVFTDLDEAYEYFAVAFDHTRVYRAVVASNLVPE